MGHIQGQSRHQGTLFPEALDELVPEEHPVSYPRIILAPFEIAGVDKLLDSSIVILARLKTCRSDQWRW